MDAVLARIIAREEERAQCATAIVYPVGYVPRKCATCGERHAPFGDADGKWFCREHRPLPPTDDNQGAILPPSIVGEPAPIPERADGRLIIENIVTGAVSTIDLTATREAIPSSTTPKGLRRERTIIEPVLPPDYADPLIDWGALEEEAHNKNSLAEAAHITDRFCRCRMKADLGFRIDKQIVWRCHECRGDKLEDE